MTSRQALLIGCAMSACSLTRPSASRVARSSSSLPPHELQNRARRWFLQPQWPQRSVSLRLGIATNEPLVPSIIFKSRTTKALSNVTEQNACSRSLFSSTSLMRTSVMTTVVLLNCSCGNSNATPNQSDADDPFVGGIGGAQPPGDLHGVRPGPGEGEDGRAAARHQAAGRPQGREQTPEPWHCGF